MLDPETVARDHEYIIFTYVRVLISCHCMHAMLLPDTTLHEVVHLEDMAVTVEHITLLSLVTYWIHHKHENITINTS